MRPTANNSIGKELTRNTLLLLLTSLLLTVGFVGVACEGPAGTEGPQGPEGPEGPEGPVGPAGEDGSVIHAGEGVPADDLGEVDDFYLDTAAAEMYGPKTQDGWGVPFTLQGPPGADGEDGADGQDGQDGKDGSQIYAGNGAPDASLGVNGDYYLDQDNYNLYGPKTTNGWGTPLNLQATTNVMYSSWLDINWNWIDTGSSKLMTIPESRITDDFLDTGIVKMYVKWEYSDGDESLREAYALPMIYSYDHSLKYTAVRTTGSTPYYPSDFAGIGLSYIALHGEPADVFDEDWQVRYVLIPGSQEIGSEAAGSSIPVDLEDYEQVRKYFGIQS